MAEGLQPALRPIHNRCLHTPCQAAWEGPPALQQQQEPTSSAGGQSCSAGQPCRGEAAAAVEVATPCLHTTPPWTKPFVRVILFGSTAPFSRGLVQSPVNTKNQTAGLCFAP